MSMDIYNVLSAEDLDKIEAYVKEFALEDSSSYCGNASYLLEWAKEKEHLYHLFGDKCIISFPIEVNKSVGEIMEELDNDREFWEILRLMRRLPLPKPVTMGEEYGHTCYPHISTILSDLPAFSNLTDFYTLATNCYNISSSVSMAARTIPLPGEKKLVLNEGCKPMRMLGRIAEAYGVKDEFEKMRLIHSRILNQKKLSGTYCLSIHPLDYMTMSDNACDWTSCMSWQDPGCYRRGTVECMNSPYMVVGYLRAKEDMDLLSWETASSGSLSWNSKKWRSLFLVNQDIIVSIKGYPYESFELNDIGVNALADLFGSDKFTYRTNISHSQQVLKKNYGWGYVDLNSNEVYALEVCAGDGQIMYTDFGSTMRNSIAFCSMDMRPVITPIWKDNKSYAEYDNYHYTCLKAFYGGKAICACCGSEAVYDDSNDGEPLVCEGCGGYNYCYECGCRIYEDEGECFDGNYYCDGCAENVLHYDALTGNAIYTPNAESLYVIMETKEESRPKFNTVRVWAYPLVYTHESLCDLAEGNSNYSLKNYLEEGCSIHTSSGEHTWGTKTYYYIYHADLTDDGIDWFDEYAQNK